MMKQSFLGRVATAVLPTTLALAATLVLSQTFATTAQAAQPQKEWTVLVYINGNNSLDSYGALDINEMEKVGTTDRVNVVVQWASESAGNTKRLLVQKDADPNTVNSPVVQTLPQMDMGDYNTLSQFITWGAQNYPAQHYMVSVWNHGAGWHDRMLGMGSISTLNISFDDVSGHSISTPQLAQALKDAETAIGQKIDIYGSDACLMAMVEVADQMAGLTDWFVGSEETEPGDGWPYDAFLSGMNAMPTITPQAVALMMPKLYITSYQNGSQGTSEATFSAFDMSKLPTVISAIQSFKTEVMASTDPQMASSLTAAVGNAQHYVDTDYVDLGDFMAKLSTALPSTASMNSMTILKGALSQFIIANVDTSTYKASTGMSIWLPAQADYAGHSAEYKTLAFDQQVGWSALIEKMLGASASSGPGPGNSCTHWWCK